MPWASQVIGFTRTRWLIGAPPCPRGAGMLSGRSGSGSSGGREHRSQGPWRAWSANSRSKTSQRAQDHADGPVGVGAGAAPSRQRARAADPLAPPWAWAMPRSDLLDARSASAVQAVDAGAALPGALVGQPARHPRRFGDRAGLLGEQQHDTRAEAGAVGREMFVARARRPRRSLAGDPGAGVAADQRSPHARGGAAGGVDQRGQRGARARSHRPPGGRRGPTA